MGAADHLVRLGGAVENVLDLPVLESNVEEGLSLLELAPGCGLSVPLVPVPRQGQRQRVAIRADDIMLAVGETGHALSARNCLSARVVELVERGPDVYVQVRCPHREEGVRLWCTITPSALRAMHLTVTMEVTVLIKTHSVTLL